MQRFVYKGKGPLCLFITVLVLGLFVTPQTRDGETVFAFNLHNLGRVFERMVQLPGNESGPVGPMGSDQKHTNLRVF